MLADDAQTALIVLTAESQNHRWSQRATWRDPRDVTEFGIFVIFNVLSFLVYLVSRVELNVYFALTHKNHKSFYNSFMFL